MKKILALVVFLQFFMTATAQRFTDSIDRGLVAIPSSQTGNFIGWHRFGEEYYDVTYNLYRDGVKIASNLSATNFSDKAGKTTSTYQVAAVIRGVEQEKCQAVNRWANQYLDIKVQKTYDRKGNDVTAHYTLNDVTLADVDGDGITEFIVKRPCDIATDLSNKTAFHRYDCYKMDGTCLWWIDMGPNMQSGADEQWDIVAYDWDMDGRAEILFRAADNLIIHHKDGTQTQIGSNTDTRWSGMEYTSSGNEYLIYADGTTAVPFLNIPYPLPRGNDSDWGDGIVGHRSTKHFFGAPFLDGRKASLFLARGIYTKHSMIAYDVNPQTHELTERWKWNCSVGGAWYGQGYHNYSIADVDWDGRDEIVYGSMIIDDNGKGLSTTGLGHGDAHHCGDLDPYRHGQELFACNENSPNMNYRNATTSQFYFRSVGTKDDGRALCANFTNQYPGCVGRSTGTGMVSTVADKVISELGDFIDWSDLNNRIYWDGDLCDEVLNSPGTEREAKIEKPGSGRIFTSSGCKMNNWSKNNPGAQADIIGDWREELILRTDDNSALRIYTSPIETRYSIYTLWHDHQYRQAMMWQPLGYNQPPHTSYFLGEMEGITQAPPPLTMSGRTEIHDGETVTDEDLHFIVCEQGNSTINVADGASPYIMTFNVPSWVQGSAGNNSTSAKTAIRTDYFTCNVVGGAFSGNMRLVKQGDGILSLPSVNETYGGNTDIWAGIVNFDGKMPNSRVWLNRFAELNTSAEYGHSIEMEYASVIRPGGTDKKGSFSCDSLIMHIGSRIVFDLYSSIDGNISCDAITANSLKIETKNWKYGPEFLAPVFEFVGHLSEGMSMLAEGKYPLMKVENIVGKTENIILKGISSQKVQLEYENGMLYLVVEGIREASTVWWMGNESSSWNHAGTENFVNNDGAGDIFVKGDDVMFNDDARLFNVTLSGELEADSIIVDNTKAYTFSGTGTVTGKATLLKLNSGKLTVNTDNAYTGGNHILGGTVSVSSLANANQPKGNLGGVTSGATKFTIENGAELQTTASVTCGSPIKLVSDDGGVLNNLSDFNMNQSFSGTKLTKKGNGWLKLYLNNSQLQTLCIQAGTVESVIDIPAKSVIMEGGVLNFDGNGTTTVTVPSGKQTTINCNGDRSTYNIKLTGEGIVSIYYPLVKGSGWYATRANFCGDWSAFSGTLKPTGVSDDGRFCLNNSYGMPKGIFNIPAGITVESTSKTFRIGEVTGNGNLGGACSLNSSAPSGSSSWTVGNSDNFSFEGKVTGAGTQFSKIGTGKMTVKGKWDNTGNVNVNEGTLHILNDASLGSGILTVKTGAVLSGVTATNGNLSNSKYVINGILAAGLSATSTSGVIGFGGKDVTFGKESQYVVVINKATSHTKLKNIGKLTMDGCITVKLGSSGLENLKPGDEIQLWEAKSFTGTPTFSFPAGLEFDTSRIDEGIIMVTSADGIVSTPFSGNSKRKTVLLNGIGQHTSSFGINIIEHRKVLVK